MRNLCFGGSFNPIHHAHLLCVRAVAEAGGYDCVSLIPSRQPPHKRQHTDLASAEDRLAMCRLAVEGATLFAVEDLEVRRAGPSYTIETARELRRRGYEAPVHWLIGADMVPTLPTWHEPLALLKEVRFVIMARPGCSFDWHSLPEPFRRLEKQVVPTPQVDLSASEIRRRVRDGKSIEYFTPQAVCAYIRERGLYSSVR